MGCSKSSSKREVYRNIGFLKKQEKSQMNNVIYHLKVLEKEKQTKPKVNSRKEKARIREEINKTEIQKKNRKDQ